MSSVTVRIKNISQPFGGYIHPSQFKQIQYDDGFLLEKENLSPIIIGLVVEYLTQFMAGIPARSAFNISIEGYKIFLEVIARAFLHLGGTPSSEGIIKDPRLIIFMDELKKSDEEKGVGVYSFLNKIKGLDDESIIAACKACTFDVWFRNTRVAFVSKSHKDTNPDRNTIENIRIMVNRGLKFLEQYGPIKAVNFTFGPDGYTQIVDSGDGDLLTEDTLWDWKVIKASPTKDHTLQIVMYWLMGKHSGNEIFKNVNKVGIFNPRLNKVYLLETSKIPQEIIEIIEKEVIGY